MKFPWVLRSEHEFLLGVVADYRNLLITERELRAEADKRTDRADARYSSLVERMLSMKRDGFKTVPMLTEPLKPSESALPAEVEFAIEQTASGDPFLRRHLNSWAQQQLASKKDPASIVYGIRYGDTPEEEQEIES